MPFQRTRVKAVVHWPSTCGQVLCMVLGTRPGSVPGNVARIAAAEVGRDPEHDT